VSRAIGNRADYTLRTAGAPGEFSLPGAVSLSDGLTENEAVAIALWNNAQFQALLADLGFARADLQDASLLTNPILSLLFPIGPKQLEATLSLPVDALWQRPHRVAAAQFDAERVAENLVQQGLALIRDVRLACATCSTSASLGLGRART